MAMWLAVACGGGTPEPGSSSAAGSDRAASADLATTLVLYRDGAYVRQRRDVELKAGTNPITFSGVARTIVPGTAQFQSLTDPATRAKSWRYWPGRATTTDILSRLTGKPVKVVRGKRQAQTGVLRAAYTSHIVLESDGRLQMIARPVEISGVYENSASESITESRIVWNVEAARAGKQTLEAAYAVSGIAWSVGYNLVLDSAPSSSGWLQGWLSVVNHSGSDLRDARAIVVDGKLTPDRPPVQPQPTYPSYNYNQPAPAAKPPPKRPPVRITSVAAPIAVSEGEQRQFSLLGSGARRVPTELTKVYDPIGRKLDRAGKKPLRRKDYGETDEEAVHIYVELDLSAAGISPELPAGEVRVYERGKAGELSPLGTTRAFSPRKSSADDDDDKSKTKKPKVADAEDRKARLAIGVAPSLKGKRTQTDYSYNETRKRLVEEFHIEVENTGTGDANILIREHLYRSLNWALAFHNEVGRLGKTGPQEIEFHVSVPAKQTTEIVYRVVYTW